jgi:hypothetical protein
MAMDFDASLEKRCNKQIEELSEVIFLFSFYDVN